MSADLDGDDIAADSEDNVVAVVLLLGVPFGVKKPDFLVDTGGGFHADAPTILISDCVCIWCGKAKSKIMLCQRAISFQPCS